MRDKALEIKELLIETVARHHPDRPRDISDDAYADCQEFLRNFLNNKGNVFTLNYDLLLYWTLMHDYEAGNDLNFTDGFTSPDEADATYVEFGKFVFDINIYYLHGAMHLFDAGHQLQKYTWVRKGEALKDQANAAMDAGKFPLFVAEGSFEKKLEKIKHHGYLEMGLRDFQNTNGKLFVFGVSFADQDKHISDAIDRGKFSDLYVSIKGDPGAGLNRELIHRVEEIARSREARLHARGITATPMDINFFDADSASVWG
jgi:hypothetical protein